MTTGPLAEGSIFAGDYRVVRPLSAGGMGAVYVATQLSTGKERALKVMQPQLVASPDFRRRFEQEAQVGARIASEHVVEVQAAGVDGPSGMPFIIMELLRGTDLAQRVETRGPVPPAEVRTIFEQLCHAVGGAHAAGIVHRDLKPENIFLAESLRAGATYVVKVLDFGIAKLAAEAGSKSTAAMGSPLWMSPEQTERAPITPAADVWALGLLAFYMLTGKPYWRAAWTPEPTVTQLLREICIEPISAASARAAEIGATHLLPPGFDGWFASCVTRAPADRFPDAQRAWTAFAGLQRAPSSPAFAPPSHDSMAFGATMGAPSGAVTYLGPRVGSTTTGVATGEPERPRRGGWVGIIAGLVFVGILVGGLLTYALVQRQASRRPVVPAATSPVVVAETATAEPMASLSALTAPPPVPSAVALTPPPLATKPPAVATVIDPSGISAAPATRGNCGCPSSDLACLMSCSANAPPKPTVTATTPAAAPLDRGALAASLGSITNTLQSCAKANGPRGPGHVSIVYLPSGYVSTVTVDPPYQGTAEGGCIGSKFHKSVIPSFSGGPTTVGKDFNIR